MKRGKKPIDPAVRLWSRVNKNGAVIRPELGPCWEWTGYRNPLGYGQIRMGPVETGKRTKLVHRVAWEMERGPIPDGLCACHKCDNPSCVRVEHLFLGTRAENNYDRDAKGRARRIGPRGELARAAKLTQNDVELIRLVCETLPVDKADVGAAWGITKKHVANLVARRCWRHVA